MSMGMSGQEPITQKKEEKHSLNQDNQSPAGKVPPIGEEESRYSAENAH